MIVGYDLLLGGDSLPCERAVLQIGETHTRFYGENRWAADSIYTKHYGDPSYKYVGPAARPDRQRKECLWFEILCDRVQHTLWCSHRLPFLHGRLVAYRERRPQIRWEVTNGERREIGGYRCLRARAPFGGRVWDVWFSPELPIDAGPWKLAGLPGLILEASDTTGSYRFAFREIRNAKRPILRTRCNPTVTTRKRWMRHERWFHENPGALLPRARFYTYDYGSGSPVLLDDEWRLPYNPIELE